MIIIYALNFTNYVTFYVTRLLLQKRPIYVLHKQNETEAIAVTSLLNSDGILLTKYLYVRILKPPGQRKFTGLALK